MTSEQSSSVDEGVDYDEVYLSRHEPVEDLTWSREREPSTHSLIEEEEEYEGDEEEGEEEGVEEEEEEGEDEGEEEDGDERDHMEGDWVVGQVDNRGHRPFILPLI